MSALPPSNGKSAPLPLILTVCATPRSSMMSPPANRVHVAPASKAAPSAAAGSVAVSGQSAMSVTRPMPKSDLSPHASARTPGPTASARRNASRLRFFARSVVSALAEAASTSRDESDGLFAPTAARISSVSPDTSSSAS